MARSSLQSLLAQSFQTHGERCAAQCGTQTLSYLALDAASGALAHALARVGVQPGHPVAVCLPRGLPGLIATVALVRLGAIYAPIDLSSPAQRQRQMLEALSTHLLVTGQAGVAADVWQGGISATFDADAWWQAHQAQDTASVNVAAWADVPVDHPAYVMFTSGSTGLPKGVLVPGSGIVRLVCGADYARFATEQRWAHMSSPAFDASTLELWAPLLNGACCVVQPQATPGLDELADFLVRQRISDAWMTSALFNAMVDDQLPSLGGLSQLLTGGDRVSPRHAERFLHAHPQVQLINGYGPTENTTFTLTHRITLDDTRAPEGIPIGRPIRGTSIRVVPVEDDVAAAALSSGVMPASRPVQPVVGELWASGEGVALGYLGDAALTARKFVGADGLRWYRTGDLVQQRSDGVVNFLGRVDRQVKVRGHRVELDEIEAQLVLAPGVAEAAVLLTEADAQDAQLVAFVSGLQGQAPDVGVVRKHLADRLPPAAVPSVLLPLARLPITLNGKTDRRALASLWALQAAPGAVSEAPTFAQRVQAHLVAQPDKPALYSLSLSLTRGELDARSAALARQLRSRGLKAGDCVPLLMPRSAMLVVTVLAVVRCGAAYAPIDTAAPGQRVQRILSVLAPRMLLIDGASPSDLVVPVGTQVLDVNEVSAAPDDASDDWAPRSDGDPLYAMFTSGSTGLPKGVLLPAQGLLPLLTTHALAEFPSDARWLMAASPAFDASTFEIWAALLNGATLVVAEGSLPSVDQLARLITERQVTHALLTTSMFNAMVDLQLPALSGLRQVLTGGERASPAHMRSFLQAHPGVRLLNAYGPTEGTVASLMHPVTVADTLHAAGIPVGSPVPGTRVSVLSRKSEAVPADEPGELLIGGAGLALGYINDPVLTSEKFIERDGERWYRSGDLVRLRRPGCYEFLGRADRQVKLQGQRIELDEVELALAGCPGVGEVAVLERGDDAASHHLAAAYAGLGGAAAPDLEHVIAEVAARLPAVALPKQWLALPRLPTTVNGKVDRAALHLLLDEAKQAGTDAAAAGEEASPLWQTPHEASLAAIWQALLPHARIGRQSHFQRIGGTSLLALHVSALVAKRLGRELSPVLVLKHPVLCELAAQLQLAPPAAVAPLMAGADGRTAITLTQGAQSLLAATQLDPTGSAYLVHSALLIRGAMAPGRLRVAFEQLARRHPLLRAHVRLDADLVQAWLEPELAPGWWQQHPPIESAPADMDWPASLLSQLNRPLDTAAAGVMRVECWPVLGAEEQLCVWTVHHAVIDEASVNHALEELHAILQGAALPEVDGSPFNLPQLEAAWVQGGALDQLAERVDAALGGLAPPLVRAPAAGAEQVFALSPPLQQALNTACERWGCTPFPLLLGAYGQAVQEVFGSAYRFVATPFSRRTEPELLEPLAYWIDVRLLEAGCALGEDPQAALRRVMATVVSAQESGFQPLSELAKRLADRPGAGALAQHLSQFAFTWRLDPTRDLPLGDAHATLIRVPQQSARYSLCLHVARVAGQVSCTIEAVQSAFTGGQVPAVWQAFVRHLDTLCANPSPNAAPALPLSPSSPPLVPPVGYVSPFESVLREAWARWLKVAPESIQAHSHFLQAGGSSLMAMRLAATLRREQGLRFDVAAFLAAPHFRQLTLLTRLAVAGSADFVRLGAASAPKIFMIIPGLGGLPVNVYELAQKIQQRVAGDTQVVIVDLDKLLR
ncbi:MAG: Long-chain-fatty-acid--CoA ligase, partial [Pseudomonadota bacterium]